MKLKRIQLVEPIMHGGALHTITNNISGARPGEIPATMELVDLDGLKAIAVTRNVNGHPAVEYVPMTNVKCFQIIAEEVKVEPKKEVKK